MMNIILLAHLEVGWAWIKFLMIQSTYILDPNSWIRFSTQIYFFIKTSLDFFKI